MIVSTVAASSCQHGKSSPLCNSSCAADSRCGNDRCVDPRGCVFPESSARAETVKVEHNYHWQQTNFWCGTASIEMMLDTPAVR